MGDGLQAAEGINGKGLFGNAVGVQPFSTQRMPLPHILPSLPSALKMRIMPVRTRCLRVQMQT